LGLKDLDVNEEFIRGTASVYIYIYIYIYIHIYVYMFVCIYAYIGHEIVAEAFEVEIVDFNIKKELICGTANVYRHIYISVYLHMCVT